MVLASAFVAQTVYYGVPNAELVVPTLLSGLFKAIAWYFTSKAAQESSWCIAPVIATLAAIINAHLSRSSSEAIAVMGVLACLLAIAQAIGIIPRSSRGRWALWGFAAIPIGFSLYQAAQIRSLSSAAIDGRVHPVESIIEVAKIDFQRLTKRQSREFPQAVAEYKHRYGMEPPPGFEDWFKFAMDNQSPIIDDFNIIYTSIAPFLRLSGQDFTRITADTHRNPDADVWLCTFNGTSKDTSCNHPLRSFDRNTALLFNTLLQNLTRLIPDVSFLVNHLDEPRVLIPPSGGETGQYPFRPEDFTHRPTFDLLTKHCPRQNQQASTARDSPTTRAHHLLPFVRDITAAKDVCRNPSFAKQHGLFLSPISFHLVEGLVPILSTGAPSTMGDIIFPSPAYTVEEDFLYDAAHGMEWEKKRNNLYWAGSTTGGYAAEDAKWKDFHRQRFVALAQGRLGGYQYLRMHNGGLMNMVSGFLNRRLFDVDFTRVFMCAVRACRDEEDYFHAKRWADKDAGLGSRLVFDLDGNGISGRYYKFLASRSAVLKQTVFREWHDDRLVPWVHYIPVSMGMEELPELVLWLTSTKSGQTRAREIADQGREWYEQALRPVDRAVYVYRLLLELARLQDPERVASKG
ncbi:glycosyltransferase family 90 protein [Cercophora newfieldiana]|uniref:Glycosyltransferase family 90 protein n=1 Tax=Cercophora newfieldiana TaxID=92897 RepID=A0AA39YGY7_9PEZI|nr:glycosyltransferase family 90 protein [Cercophora newfieldiana]